MARNSLCEIRLPGRLPLRVSAKYKEYASRSFAGSRSPTCGQLALGVLAPHLDVPKSGRRSATFASTQTIEAVLGVGSTTQSSRVVQPLAGQGYIANFSSAAAARAHRAREDHELWRGRYSNASPTPIEGRDQGIDLSRPGRFRPVTKTSTWTLDAFGANDASIRQRQATWWPITSSTTATKRSDCTGGSPVTHSVPRSASPDFHSVQRHESRLQSALEKETPSAALR